MVNSGKADPIILKYYFYIRDARGFAVKFYTEGGIWDLVSFNAPVFAVKDPILFPSFVHSQKKNPVTGLLDLDSMWDFVSLRPETIHLFLRLFSHVGIPDGYRHQNGHAINTFKFVNKDGEAVYCKFHFFPDQGEKYITIKEATKIAASDPNYAVRDLYNAIHDGNFPIWTFKIQLMAFEEAEKFRWNPFDATKLWPEDEFPYMEVGKIVLDKSPTNFFQDVEQAAFDPGNLITGIEPSPDRLLQGRMFSYGDTQRYRLGTNYLQLPVNDPRPYVNVTNYHRDGIHCIFNQNGAPSYFPNSFNGPQEAHGANILPFPVSGDVSRYNEDDDDHYSQPGTFYNEMTEENQDYLVENLVSFIQPTKEFIQKRLLHHFYKIDKKFGGKVKAGLVAAKNRMLSLKRNIT